MWRAPRQRGDSQRKTQVNPNAVLAHFYQGTWCMGPSYKEKTPTAPAAAPSVQPLGPAPLQMTQTKVTQAYLVLPMGGGGWGGVGWGGGQRTGQNRPNSQNRQDRQIGQRCILYLNITYICVCVCVLSILLLARYLSRCEKSVGAAKSHGYIGPL